MEMNVKTNGDIDFTTSDDCVQYLPEKWWGKQITWGTNGGTLQEFELREHTLVVEGTLVH